MSLGRQAQQAVHIECAAGEKQMRRGLFGPNRGHQNFMNVVARVEAGDRDKLLEVGIGRQQP